MNVQTQQNSNQSNNLAYQAAVQRANKIASKLKTGSEEPGVQIGIKRPISDNQGPDVKRMNMEEGTTTEQVAVPDNMVGMIIGRGGEQITRLQQESGCKIQMAPDSGGQPVRMCTLTGSAVAIAHAKSLIDGVIANNGNFNSNSMGAGGSSGHLELMVPGNKVGLVIGKGGETIKMLQEQTGAKIVIVQENSEHADQKPLRIFGTPDVIEKAKSRVLEILDQTDQAGFGGRGGRGRGGFQGRGRGRSMSGWPSGHEAGGEAVDYVLVSSDKVGLVIGKGGETIKSINQASGAHCEIDKKAPPEAIEKNFIIRGSAENVERAKQMVLEKIGAAPGSGYGSFPGQTFTPNGGSSAEQRGNSSHRDRYDLPMNTYQPNSGGSTVNQGPVNPDYSAQWVEYYRSVGMVKEAEMIEQQSVGDGGGTAAPQQGATQDYSAQWAEYYRSMGKVKEAEAIEAQIRAKAGQTGPSNSHQQGYYPPQQVYNAL